MLYVDDMLEVGPNKVQIQELKTQLARKYEKKDLEPANKDFRDANSRDKKDRKVWLSQKKYLLIILRRFNMQDCKPISTPLSINCSSRMSLSSEVERMEKSRVPSASVVDNLMNVMMCTKPDIAQAVGVISRFMAGLVESSEVLARGP